MGDMSNAVFPTLPDPKVYIGLDEQLRKGIAQQMRLLADLLDPPTQGQRVAGGEQG